MISPKYFNFENEKYLKNWKDLFTGLGVKSELAVERINHTMSPSSADVRKSIIFSLLYINVLGYHEMEYLQLE